MGLRSIRRTRKVRANSVSVLEGVKLIWRVFLYARGRLCAAREMALVAVKANGHARLYALQLELRLSELESNVLSYNALISVCERSQLWDLALGLLAEMRRHMAK